MNSTMTKLSKLAWALEPLEWDTPLGSVPAFSSEWALPPGAAAASKPRELTVVWLEATLPLHGASEMAAQLRAGKTRFAQAAN